MDSRHRIYSAPADEIPAEDAARLDGALAASEDEGLRAELARLKPQIEALRAEREAALSNGLPDPTEDDFNDPWFDAIWEVIKGWDIDTGDGPQGATGNHVRAILRAVRHYDVDLPAPDPATWECKIGEADRDSLPHGADLPMRNAVRAAYQKITGEEPEFIFSGWAGRLTPIQRGIVEGERKRSVEFFSPPSPEQYRAALAHGGILRGDIPVPANCPDDPPEFNPEEPSGPASRAEHNNPGYP